MKRLTMRSMSILLTFVLCFSMIFGVSITAIAENVKNIDYVKSGQYIYNWGTRGEVATYLSQNAKSFYTKNNTSYQELAALSGAAQNKGYAPDVRALCRCRWSS